MTYSVPEKAKLWREGWDAFKRTFLELLPWIAGLAVILALVDAPSLAADIEEAQTALQSLDPGSEVLQKDVSTSHILLKIFGSLCQFAGYFVFSVLYLRREPILMVPAFEPQLFLRWLGQVLLAALILIGLVVGIAAIGGLGAFIMSSLIKGDIRIMMMVIAVLALGGCIYVGLKFSLVGTMVLCGVSSPIKSSWRMTDNQWWRIVWGHLCMVSVVWLILIAVFLIPVIVLVSVAEPQSALFVQGLSIVLGFSQATVLAAGSVYLCTTFRVLHQEQGLPVLRESGSM